MARCCSEVRERIRRFDDELTHLRRGYYAPEIRAASLAFHRAQREPGVHTPGSPFTRPAPRATLHVLVVVEPSVGHLPEVHVRDGRLFEPHLTLSDADRSALETALRLRDAGGEGVSIEVAAVGPRGLAQTLREAVSLGVDRVHLLTPETEVVTPDSAAAALAEVLRNEPAFDLILGGGSSDDEEGLLAPLTAAHLGVPYDGSAAEMFMETPTEMRLVGIDGKERTRNLPAAVAVEAKLPLRSFTLPDFLTHLAKPIEMHRWPKKIAARPIVLSAQAATPTTAAEEQPLPLTPREAAHRVLVRAGRGAAGALAPYDGPMEDVAEPTLFENLSTAGAVLAVVSADAEGHLQPTAHAVVKAARVLAGTNTAVVRPLALARPAVLLLAPAVEELQRRALAQLLEWHNGDVVLVPVADAAPEVKGRFLAECWPFARERFHAIVGEAWAESAFAALAAQAGEGAVLALRVRRLALSEPGKLTLETGRLRGKLLARQTWNGAETASRWLTLAPEAEITEERVVEKAGAGRVQRWSPSRARFPRLAEIQRLLEEAKQEAGLVRLADADFIIDVGYGIGNQDGYEEVIEPLEKALRTLGVRNLVIGGSRKVTEELHLLPADRQIGQSGVSVNPQVLLAIGISGAPQHLNYIGTRATIFAFNRDPDAPLLTLNQRQPRPRVFPIVGDLFETVPAFVSALREEAAK